MPIFRTVSLKERFLARFYDTAMFWLFYFLFGIFIGAYSPLLGWLVCYILYLLRDGFNGGAGFGKATQSILVINSDNFKECSYGRSILRNVISDISAILITIKFLELNIGLKDAMDLAIAIVIGIDVWRILNTVGGQRTGDLIAHTRVVYWEDLLEYNIQRQKEERTLDEAVAKIKSSLKSS